MFINDMLIRRDHDQVIRNVHRRGQDDMGGLHGVTGTNNIAGMITDEDENRIWNEPILRMKTVNLMRKTCVRTRQSMMLLKTPLLGATMRIEPASDSNADIKNALLVEEMLFDSPFFRWDDILRQQLTYLDFGHSILEKAYTRLNGKLWLNKIEFRLQDTIFEWHAPEGVLQQVEQSNVFHSSEREPLPMPAESIIHTSYEQEGNNFAGFSALRPAWINWHAKMFLLKGDMVRYERFGIGTPMLETESPEIPDDAVEAIQKLRSNDEGFLAKTKKWTLSIFGGGRNSGMDVITMVMFHDHQIIFNVMANFMAKGEAQVGNFALTKVAADMFFNNVEREANHIENVWNEPSGLMSNIPQIMELNVGEGVPSPKLRIENLQLDDLGGFAERASKYVAAGLLDPTDDIKRHVREIEHLSLTGLDDEQLEDMVNINPTIKRIDSGRPYVLQYRRVNNMLLLQGTAVVESNLEKVIANQLKTISGTLAIKGRHILETADDPYQVESMCSAVKIPHNVTLTNSIIVEAGIDDKYFDMVKAFVNEFYETIREIWEAEVVRQFESERTDLSDIAKLVTLIPTKAISKKIQGLT